jgi:hypothetical protein
MPIHDLSYQHWNGTRSRRSTVGILGRDQLRLLLGRRIVRLLLLVSAIFTLVWGGMIYLESRVPDSGPLREVARVVRVDAHSFWRFLTLQRLVHLLLCLAAADLVALDRRHRAMQIYLAKPLRPRDYILGKAAALAVLLSLTTWVPGLFLVLLKTALRADLGWLGEQPWLPASILGYAAVLVPSATLLTLAVSSLSASPRLASAQVFAFVALSAAAGQLLASLTRSDGWQLLSFNGNLDRVASALFDEVPRHDVAAWMALAALGVLTAASGVLLRRRVRPIDIVGGS